MSTTGREVMTSGEPAMYAYHDGELGAFGRWRFERRLARSADLRAQLDKLREIGSLMRESQPTDPSPDLWDAIALRLPAADAQREAPAESAGPLVGWLSAHRPLAAAAATAALAVALVLGIIREGPGTHPGVISWLDTGGRSVMVLEDQSNATIVWLLEAPTEGASLRARLDAV